MNSDKVLELAKQAEFYLYGEAHHESMWVVCATVSNLNKFVALIQQQMIKDGWRSPELWVQCKDDKDAPHGFDRNGSHSKGGMCVYANTMRARSANE